jgi:hypothetical protein
MGGSLCLIIFMPHKAGIENLKISEMNCRISGNLSIACLLIFKRRDG